jgi:hypothetical protein
MFFAAGICITEPLPRNGYIRHNTFLLFFIIICAVYIMTDHEASCITQSGQVHVIMVPGT